MANKKLSKDTTTKPKDKAKEGDSSEALGVCEKAFSPESARLKDKDEPCEDGIQR